MNKIITIHQPNYIPWIGYFHKIFISDVFVFLDSTQYSPGTFINRSFISQGQNSLKLIIPAYVPTHLSPISDVIIDTKDFARKHLTSLKQTYFKSRFYKEIFNVIQPSYEIGKISLAEFNIRLITDIVNYLEFEIRLIRSSSLDIHTKKNNLLIDITKVCGGNVYISGNGAKNYIEGHEKKYSKNGIRLAYQNFVHPEYNQLKKSFLPGLSILDLLFNKGKESSEIISNNIEDHYKFVI